jgi:hypothetical protein
MVMRFQYLLFCVTLSLIACHKLAISTTNSGGTDIGGSNILFGKPVEASVVNVKKDFKEYNEILIPILNNIRDQVPGFYDLLEKSLSSRTWYLFPGKIEQLVTGQIGVPLKVDIGQYAIHTPYAVWISEEERAKLIRESNLESAAVHLLHEMVMAIRVDQNLKNNPSANSILSLQDYEDIRAVVVFIFNKTNTVTDFQELLFQRHFYPTDHPSRFTSLFAEGFKDPKTFLNVLFRQNEERYMPYLYQTYKEVSNCRYTIDPEKQIIEIFKYNDKTKERFLVAQLRINQVQINEERNDLQNQISSLDRMKVYAQGAEVRADNANKAHKVMSVIWRERAPYSVDYIEDANLIEDPTTHRKWWLGETVFSCLLGGNY